MDSEILKVILIISTFQLFFFGMVSVFLRPKKDYHYWLAAFLFLKSILVLMELACWYYHLIDFNHQYRLAYSLLSYSLYPVFYIFVIKASRQNFSLIPSKLLMLVPYAIIMGILHMPGWIWDNHAILLVELMIVNYYTQSFIYFALSLKIYKQFQLSLGNFLTQDSIYRLRWLRLVIWGFIFLAGISFVTESLALKLSRNFIIVNIILEIIFLVLLNILLFLGTRQPKAIDEIPHEKEVISEKDFLEAIMGHQEKVTKYAFSTLSEPAKNEILHNLNYLMDKKKYYKTSNITLKMLAEELNVQSKHLSQVINERCGQNFCEYINSLRVEDAKKQLSDTANTRKTILEIIYDTGFNSKSVFNTIFKEITGETPTSYRKSRINKTADIY